MRVFLGLAVLPATLMAACSGADGPAPAVNRVADDVLRGYYEQFPEQAFDPGYPDAPADRFGDFSPAAISAWDARVDAWTAELAAMDVGRLAGRPEALTYGFTSRLLEALADLRVCRGELWNVSPTWSGWQSMFAATLAVQPIATDDERRAAVARVRDIARYLDVEIQNLRRGTDLGYLAAQSGVDRVVAQMTTLTEGPPEESPFYSPAERSDDPGFRQAYRDALTGDAYPAMAAYRDYLRDSYKGREAAGVAANPDGAACYAAAARYWSSSPMEPEGIHRLGLSEMARLRTEMLALAQQAFGTGDLLRVFEDLRTQPEYTFADEESVLEFVRLAVDRSRGSLDAWFGDLPDAGLGVEAIPAFEQNSGGGYYSAGSPDGSLPGTVRIGTFRPGEIPRATTESLAFHEGYPGHHLQTTVAQQNTALHPILRYMYVSGSAEGWGLYAERLADEMGLYSGPVTRFGMLSNQAFRAARLVVDTGIHVMGWSRDEAVEYLLDNTAMGPEKAGGEVDRYIAVPGQATAYMLGSLEIQRLRHRAEDALGARFDVREFHRRILAPGGVPLPMLDAAVDDWLAGGEAR